jgi:hypothetical protein
MKPQELLGVVVRAAGLFVLLMAGGQLLQLVIALVMAGGDAISGVALIAVLVEGFVGLLIVWSADQIVGYSYR